MSKLFNRSHPDYRQQIVDEVIRDAAKDLGRNIARQIKGRANQHYAALASRLSHGNSKYQENHYSDATRGLAALIALIVHD